VARGWIHTVHRDGRWFNEQEEAGQVGLSYSDKHSAILAGREIARARKTEHVIHNLDGTIAERNSYGNDPHPPPG
jgi:hypothetical protein